MAVRHLSRSFFVVILVALGLAAWSGVRALREPAAWDPTGLLGRQVPAVTLRDVAGRPQTIMDALGGRPGLVIVAAAADCLSCANYAFELRVARTHVPGLAAVLVGSGPERDVFTTYFRTQRLERNGLLDPTASLLRALGMPRPPVALLVAADGRILLVDARSSSAAAQYPPGRLVSALSAALTPAANSESTR